MGLAMRDRWQGWPLDAFSPACAPGTQCCAAVRRPGWFATCVVLMVALGSRAVAQTTPAAPAAPASAYPSQALRVIVPWPAGGTTDVIARLVSNSLSVEFGHSVVVDNIAGAGGNIGTQQFVRTRQDGHTLLMASSSTNAANPHLYQNLGFDPIKDFTPIALVARVPSVLVVAAESPFKSLGDIVSADRDKRTALTYASAGIGSSAHLAGELLKNLARISALHVPYKGIAPAAVDVMGGRVSYTFDTGISGYIEGGKFRPLAIAAARRAESLPDVPTFEELGMKGMIMNVWFGIAGTANMPPHAVSRVNGAVNKAIAQGELLQRLRRMGSDATPGTASVFAEFWRAEVSRYGGIVSLSGARLD